MSEPRPHSGYPPPQTREYSGYPPPVLPEQGPVSATAPTPEEVAKVRLIMDDPELAVEDITRACELFGEVEVQLGRLSEEELTEYMGQVKSHLMTTLHLAGKTSVPLSWAYGESKVEVRGETDNPHEVDMWFRDLGFAEVGDHTILRFNRVINDQDEPELLVINQTAFSMLDGILYRVSHPDDQVPTTEAEQRAYEIASTLLLAEDGVVSEHVRANGRRYLRVPRDLMGRDPAAAESGIGASLECAIDGARETDTLIIDASRNVHVYPTFGTQLVAYKPEPIPDWLR